MNDIDATCGFHLENVDYQTCVEEVMEVVAGLTAEGCVVTGGTAVVDFISTVSGSSEGFASLTRLACSRTGECYADIQNAVKYCKNNPEEENCMDYVTCDCLTDFFSVLETLPEGFVNLDSAITDKVEIAGSSCICQDLNSRALSLEIGPSCALSVEILKARDILAGDDVTLADTCNADDETTCVDGIVEVVGGFIEYGCAVTYDNAAFIYTLHDSSEDFNTVTDFACNNDCYPAIKTCQNENNCTDSLSCECMATFLSIVEGLSPDSKEDFLSIDDSTLSEMQLAVDKCNCDDLNAKAALFQDEGYCALHNSIVKGRSIFAGSSSDVQSTCTERHLCVEKVTEIVAQIDNEGCEMKLDTDNTAKFIYYVNNNTDWSEMTHFICNNHEDLPLELGDECYDDMKVVSEDCKGDDAVDNCTNSASFDCLDTFLGMVDRLSDDDLLGIKSATLGRMKSGKEALQANNVTVLPENVTASPADQSQPEADPPSNGATFQVASMAFIMSSIWLALLV